MSSSRPRQFDLIAFDWDGGGNVRSIQIEALGVVGSKPKKFISQIYTVTSPGRPPDDGKKDQGKKDDQKKDDTVVFPKVDQFYAVVIHNTANLSPEYAAVLGDTAFWNSLKGLGRGGNDWDIMTTGTQKAIDNGYVREAAKKQNGNVMKPGLVVMEYPSGKVVYNEIMPTDKNAIQAIVKGLLK